MPAFSLPNLRNDVNSAQDMKQLKNYLFMLVENLEYTLNNLDAENLTADYNASTSYAAVHDASVSAQQAAAQAQAVAVQVGRYSVQSSKVIQAINETTETGPIKGSKIITTAAAGEITLLGKDSAGNIVPCKIAVSGDATSGYTITIRAV